MLKSYYPIYELALSLGNLRTIAEYWKISSLGTPKAVSALHGTAFENLLDGLQRKCGSYGFTPTAELAKRIISRDNPPQTYAEMLVVLNNLDDSLSHQLEIEAVFRIPPTLKDYFEQKELFGAKVAKAFPSCERDIKKAGSCYALEQEDACVHHLMLVLERGLNALATKVGVSFHYTDWQKLIDLITVKLNSGMPRGPELDFYRHVNAQFGFLKEAYRKHSAHARDDPYDMPKALSILNHVCEFMQELAKGGLSE